MSATGRGGVRSPGDFYSTPDWLVEAIMPEVRRAIYAQSDREYRLLEPCEGSGAITRVLNKEFPKDLVYGFDLNPQNGGVSTDFLIYNPGFKFDCIITNPPYSLAMEFVEKGLSLLEPDGCMFMLLRLNWLGSKKRAAFLRKHPPSLFVTPRRPSFEKGGTDSCDYAWFRWVPSMSLNIQQVVILNTENTAPKVSKSLKKRKNTWVL